MPSTQVATSPIYGRPLLEEMDHRIITPATRMAEVGTAKTESVLLSVRNIVLIVDEKAPRSS